MRLIDKFRPRPKCLRNGAHGDIPYKVWISVLPYALVAAISVSMLLLSNTLLVDRMLESGNILGLCMATFIGIAVMLSVLMSSCYWISYDRKYYLADIPCERKDRIWVIALLLVIWPFLIVSYICMRRHEERTRHVE